MGCAGDYHAAEIIVRANVSTLLVAGHHEGSGLGFTIQEVHFFGHAIVMRLAPGAKEISGFGPAAGNVVVGDDIFDVAERIYSVVQKRSRFIFRHGFVDDAFAHIHATGHHAAIAGGSTKARFGSIQHNRLNAMFCKLQCGVQSGITSPHNGYCNISWQINFR